ncbi:MAG: TAXI family TRAP transporter solute-binding subunit [Granulosicoccus sp.]
MAVLSAAVLWLTYQFVEPAPPNSLTIATGNAGGAYYAFAQQLAQEFEAEGVALILRETAGSVENLKLLDEDNDVQIAFLQSGIAEAAKHVKLEGLASLYFEPLWLFSNQSTRPLRVNDLQGQRVAIGIKGSGTHQVAMEILAQNGLPGTPEINEIPSNAGSTRQQSDTLLQPITVGDKQATDALLSGTIDAAMTISSADSTMVKALIKKPDIQLMSFQRADAYARRYAYLSSLTLPEGVIDLTRNIPSQEIKLIGAAATLVARDDLHPALGDLVMRAAARVANTDTLFSERGRFPSRDYLDFPISDEADRYFKYGVPFLQRYLPFWAANLIDRLKLLALPLVALALPLTRLLPPAYRWSVRKKIFRWYEEVQLIDQAAQQNPSSENLQACLKKLNRIENEAREITVPLGYASELYSLRQHIDLLNQQINRQQG